ncbi:MAG TPA: CGNR zinc finger domain-containing protein [Solirubrobacteraceae bacterium]|nr:CGNR zinc finger domain-containing protein [Solirubrobacteraceae bacterium]
MSKTQEAPGELERVREFVNSADIEAGTDELSSPAALGSWLATRGLRPGGATREDLRRAIELREALREVLLAHTNRLAVPAQASAALNQAAQRARLQLRFDEQAAAVLEPEASGVTGALGRLLAIVSGAIADGSWERLKACREHSCEWAFYDHTKNRSGAWCTMDVCGNRAKARAYRERRQ